MTTHTEADCSTVANCCEILGNRRRLLTIKYLSLFEVGAVVDVRQIARSIRAIELELSPREVSSQEYESAYNSLIQLHLPKLATEGIIEYDQSRKRVSITPTLNRYELFANMAEMLLHTQRI